VSRGGTALLITQASDVCVPVVNIPFISNELVRALRQAVRISRHVGIVRFANTLPPDIATLSDILDARIVDMPILSECQAVECIADAVEDGIGVIVGGVCGVSHAAAAGLPGVLIESCEDSLHLALSEAINVAGKTRVLQRRIAVLSEHEWSGNVRELRNVVQRLIVSGRNPTISARDVKHALGDQGDSTSGREILRSSVRSHEFDRIARVLEDCGGNRTLAAERLGISRVTLWRKLKDHVTCGS